MIFDSNIKSYEQYMLITKNQTKHKKQPKALFIGRFQPPHQGHSWLFEQKLNEGVPVLIAIRDIEPDEKNPLYATEVKKLWEKIYEGQDVEVIIIPDIESVNWGRGVGYKTLEHVPPTDICNVSATQIRNFIKDGSDEWKKMVNEKIHEDIIKLLK
jgi:nicotinamide mononucleotide adenylyltransferase